jgi:hypothetical protein
MVKSEEGPECPTCRKHYGNIERHGTKHHPYEMGHDAAWLKLLSDIGGKAPPTKYGTTDGQKAAGKAPPLDPPKPSVRVIRQLRWESPQPYVGRLHLYLAAKGFDEADDTFRDAVALIKALLKEQMPKITIEYEQTHERF